MFFVSNLQKNLIIFQQLPLVTKWPLNLFFIRSKIIWLGDLNYRLAAAYDDTLGLLKKNDWQALLEKDQVIYIHSHLFCVYGLD